MSTATAAKKLTVSQARALHDADVRVKRAEAELAEAEGHRFALRAKYKALVPLSQDQEERAKGIREIVVGAFKVRLVPMVSGESFSLKRYKDAGHAITHEMREAMGGKKPYDRWTVNGPPKTSRAVEPA